MSKRMPNPVRRAACVAVGTIAVLTLAAPPASASTCEACSGVTDETNGTGVSLVPSTDPADYLITLEDILAAEAKEAIVAQDKETLALQLADGALMPTPDESQVAVVPPNDGSDPPPPSGKVTVSGYAQGATQWCLPASVATSLRAYGVTVMLQQAANALGQGGDTQKPASSFEPARKFLNNKESRNHYIYRDPGSAEGMLGYVQSDIYHRRAPVVAGYYTKLLPWWSNSRTQGGHALTTYGYYTANGGGFYVWDSAYSHTENLKVKDGYAANKAMSPAIHPFLW